MHSLASTKMYGKLSNNQTGYQCYLFRGHGASVIIHPWHLLQLLLERMFNVRDHLERTDLGCLVKVLLVDKESGQCHAEVIIDERHARTPSWLPTVSTG